MSNDFPLYTTDYISGPPQAAVAIAEDSGGNYKRRTAPQGNESESGTGRCPRYVSDLLRF